MMIMFHDQKMSILMSLKATQWDTSLTEIKKKIKNSCEQNFDNFWQLLNFLDVSIILHQNGRLEIDVFFKEACMAILTTSVIIRNT